MAFFGASLFAGSNTYATDYYASTTGNGDPLAIAVGKAKNPGDRVIVHNDGVYTEDSPITVLPGVTIVGEGSGDSRPHIKTTFGIATQDVFDVINAGGDCGFYFDENSNLVGKPLSLFTVVNANNNKFDNLIIDGRRWLVAGEPNFTEGANRDVSIAAGIIIKNNSGGQTQVSNCEFDNIRGAGVYINSGFNYDIYNNKFSNCGLDEGVFRVGAADFGSLGSLTTKSVDQLTVRKNTFVNRKDNEFGYGTGYGVLSVRNNPDTGKVYIGSSNASEKNTFDLNAQQTFNEGTSNFDIEWRTEAMIQNNEFHGTISAIDTAATGVVYDNVFDHRDSYYYGIEANGSNLIVDNNKFSGRSAFLRSFDKNRPQNLTVTRNQIDGGGTLINLSSGADGLNVFNNTIKINQDNEVAGGNDSAPVGGSGFSFINVSADDAGNQNASSDWEIKNNIILGGKANTQLIELRNGAKTPLGLQINNNLFNSNINYSGFVSVDGQGNLNGGNIVRDIQLDANLVPPSNSDAIDGGTDLYHQGGAGTDNSVPNFYGYYAQAGRGFTSPKPDIGWKEVGSKTGGGTSGGSFYRIRCRWDYNPGAPDYLYDGGTYAQYSALPSGSDARYQWQVIVTDDGSTRFKNRSTGEVLNIENFNTNNDGNLRCDQAGADGWLSSRWKRQPTDSGYERYESDWQAGNYIHIQDRIANAQYGGINNGWYSAQWTLEAVSGADADTPTNLNAGP